MTHNCKLCRDPISTIVETVFICHDDDIVIVKASDGEDCPVCESPMCNAGWFESREAGGTDE